MLNREICFKCYKEAGKKLHLPEEESKTRFDCDWLDGIVFCTGEDGLTRDSIEINGDVPSKCHYILEHTVC